jgi:Fe-S-cluster containining protein
MPENKIITECERCGTCCTRGGPALHIEDKTLLDNKIITTESLITIRTGEPVFMNGETGASLSRSEIIKFKGKDGSWSCIFYKSETQTCSLYKDRPLECVLLKCWNTTELEAVSGKDLLSRRDIISPEEPIIKFIDFHENECRLDFFKELDIAQSKIPDNISLEFLNDLANRDLEIRTMSVKELGLSLEEELFYLGRPLFKILMQFGLVPNEINGKIFITQK